MMGALLLELLVGIVRLIETAVADGKVDPMTAAEMAVEARKIAKFGKKS